MWHDRDEIDEKGSTWMDQICKTGKEMRNMRELILNKRNLSNG